MLITIRDNAINQLLLPGSVGPKTLYMKLVKNDQFINTIKL